MSADMLTADHLREMATTLTRDERLLALAIVRAAGWTPLDNPPLWVWQEAYLMVRAGRTEDSPDKAEPAQE